MCGVTDASAQNCILTTYANGESNSTYDFAEVKSARSWVEILSLPIAPKIFSLIWNARKGDILIAHYPFPLCDIAITLFSLNKLPPIYVYWHSNIVSQKLSKWLFSPFTYIMLHKAKRILVASPLMIENSKILSHFKNKCLVVPYGIESSANISSDEVPEVRDYFLCVGRHVKYKGFEYAIRSMVSNSYRLIIIGDGELFAYHKKLIRDLGLEDKVTLLRSVDDEVKNRYIQGCKALLVPSVLESEAFALVQLEAMRAGKPVINTFLKSGVPWVARHYQEGITVEPKNCEQLDQAMTKLMADDTLYKKLANGAHARFFDTFTEKKFSEEVKNLLLKAS